MDFYSTLVTFYNNFLAIFPPELQWIVTLAIMIGVVILALELVRRNILFLIILIVLLPFLLPVVARFFGDVGQFILFLFQQLGLGRTAV